MAIDFKNEEEERVTKLLTQACSHDDEVKRCTKCSLLFVSRHKLTICFACNGMLPSFYKNQRQDFPDDLKTSSDRGV